jgi:hypothetical protein
VEFFTTKKWAWYNNGVAIAGATGSAFTIPSSLVGRQLSCSLAATNSAGTTAGTSAPVTVAA